jgi:hypothetical protein
MGNNLPRAAAQFALALVVLSASAPAQRNIVPIGSSLPPRPGAILTLSGSHLNYYGGRVISNVQVAVVFWTANVDFTTQNQIKGFYSTVDNSPYIDMLSEYNTVGLTGFVDGQPGSNQTIGRGTALGPYTITPSINTSTTVDDNDIQAELQAQITAGNLPPPATDGAGNVNTLYMVYFPRGYTITLQGSASCLQFCGYHGTYINNNLSIPYGVMPDLGSGGCRSGCGSGTTFQNLTSVSSHELAESITDTEVGIATVIGRPLAWVDPTGSGAEIGDLCNHQHATLSGYTVQNEWSNSRNACFAPAGDILASTTTLQIAAVPSLPSRLRATVSFTAMVQGSGPTPTGNVTFFEGATQLGVAPLSSGQASLTTYQLRGGFRQIQASYSGDANYAPSFDTQVLRYRPPFSR